MLRANRAHGCSCERIGDRVPPEIANLSINMYGGNRFLKVHGGLTRGFVPCSGIIAGCSRAKDILHSVIGGIGHNGDLRARIYVDDIALTTVGVGPYDAAVKLHAWVQMVKLELQKKTHGS